MYENVLPFHSSNRHRHIHKQSHRTQPTTIHRPEKFGILKYQNLFNEI